MIRVEKFVFNPFQENTYVLYNDQREAIIVDAGMSNHVECSLLDLFLQQNELKPIAAINTHCHVDHVSGLAHLFNKYGLKTQCHEKELKSLKSAVAYGQVFGFQMEEPPKPDKLLSGEGIFKAGSFEMEMLFTPGHSAGSICFYSKADAFVLAGDVLFQGSIGRTDLPGGHYDTLIHNIQTKLMPMPDDTLVYSGHGQETTIGVEKVSNPFLVG